MFMTMKTWLFTIFLSFRTPGLSSAVTLHWNSSERKMTISSLKLGMLKTWTHLSQFSKLSLLRTLTKRHKNSFESLPWLAEATYHLCVRSLVVWFVNKSLRLLHKSSSQSFLNFTLNLVKSFHKFQLKSPKFHYNVFSRESNLGMLALNLLLEIIFLKLSRTLNSSWLVRAPLDVNCWKTLQWLDWEQEKKEKSHWLTLTILKTQIWTDSSFSDKSTSQNQRVEQQVKSSNWWILHSKTRL